MRKERKVGNKYEFERYLPYDIEDLSTFRILSNKVLVEIKEEEYNKTEGGIIIVRDMDFAAHSVRRALVIKLPEKLTCIKGDGSTMSWECDIDIKEGDIVYMNHQNSYHCYPFNYEDKLFKLVNYDGIIFAQRDEEIVMCNGMVLLEKYYDTIGYGKFEKKVENKKFGYVKAIGKPNRRIKSYCKKTKKETLIDDSQINLNIGDKVFIHDPSRVFELEDYAHAKFDNRKIYNVCSRRRISAIV